MALGKSLAKRGDYLLAACGIGKIYGMRDPSRLILSNSRNNKMKTASETTNSARGKYGSAILVHAILTSISIAAPTTLTGDYKIVANPAASPAEAGDLVVAGILRQAVESTSVL
jgi:hypothetical protein